MMSENIKTILISGRPRTGKTTLVKKIAHIMKEKNLSYSGFYTEEIQFPNGNRKGFDIVTLEGKRAELARVDVPPEKRGPKIGKYFVLVKEFENLALPTLHPVTNTLLIIDEIGKMELLSESFKEKVNEILGTTTILATIPVGQNKLSGVIERLKKDSSTMIVELTQSNRNNVADRIIEIITRMVQK